MSKFISALAVLGFLALSSGASATISANFSGTVNRFVPGPFPVGTEFTGSFTLDESVIPTGGGIQTFAGAVDNFLLTIGTDNFVGQDGRLQQFTSADLSTEFVSINLGTFGGSVTGITANGFSARSAAFDLRGPDLFDATNVYADDIVFSDLGFAGFNMRFDDTSTQVVENILLSLVLSDFTLTNDNVEAPEPATLALFLSGLLGLSVLRRRVRA